jgi:Tfp pilus assembly PilM family ATPase/Tfp pilus assembly protein PilN
MKPSSSPPPDLVRKIFERGRGKPEKVSVIFKSVKPPADRPARRKTGKAGKSGKLPPVAIAIDGHGVLLAQAAPKGVPGSPGLCAVDAEPFATYQPDPPPEAVSGALKALLARHTVGRRAVVTVSARDVKIYNLHFPPMAEDELKSAVQWKVEQIDPFGGPREELIYHYVSWRSLDVSEPRHYVTVFCVRKALVDQRRALLDGLGLALAGLEVKPVGLLYFYGRQIEARDDDVTMWVEVGGRESWFVISARGVPSVCKPLAVGVDTVRRQLEERLGLTEEQSGDALWRLGLRVKFESVNDDEGRKRSLGLLTFFESLVLEIGHNFKTFSYEFEAAKVVQLDRIVLCGIGSRVPFLDKFISDGLGVEVRVLDPFAGLAPETPLPGGDAASAVLDPGVSVGLALGYCSAPEGRFNLLSGENSKGRLRDLAGQPFFRMAAAVMALAAVWTGFQAKTLVLARSESLRLEDELKSARASLTGYQRRQMDFSRVEGEVLEQKLALENRLKFLDSARRRPEDFAEAVAGLALDLPENVWLESFDYADNELKFVGVADQAQDIMKFIDNLKRSDTFHGIVFRQTERKKDKNLYSFEVAAKLGP